MQNGNNKGQIILESALIFCIVIGFFMFIFYKVIHPVNRMMVSEYREYMEDEGRVGGRIEVTKPQ